jgi:hypothetical protein
MRFPSPAPQLGRGALDALGFEFFRLFAAGLYRIASGIARAFPALRSLLHSGLYLSLAVRNSLRNWQPDQRAAIFMPAKIIFVHDDPQFIERAAAALRLAGHKVVAFGADGGFKCS